jgi:hypothetical protein
MQTLIENEVGKVVKCHFDEHKASPAINPSALADGLIGLAEVDVRAIHNSLAGGPKTFTAASQDRMDRGSLLHMMLLEPERLATDVAIFDGAKRAGAAWEAFEVAATGKLVLRQKDYTQVIRVANTLKNHPMVGEFLDGCDAEISIFCQDQNCDVRGRVDAIDFKRRRIIDIKTTDAGIDQDSVSRTIKNLKYREKLALYRRWAAMITGTNPTDWRCWNLFLSMDLDAPGIRRVRMTDDALEWGEMRMLNALRRYREAVANEEFPVYAVDDFCDVKPWEIEPEESGHDIDFD